MTTTTTPPTTAPRRTALLPVGARIWRAVDGSGRALGNVRSESTPAGERYLALRFHAPTRAFRTVGEFWSADDAVDSLRFGR